ncbi:hypothetical protein [Streptomyces sp. NPDC005423]|uniref:hypothetical protein n=1 Tax=Streptomyces sp. NPDC005423 TaxID=3155343 RepID=UPI0033B7B0D8
MSVISHLYHGELGDWCQSRLTGSEEAAQRLTAHLREHEILRPEGPVDRHHWSQADRALGLRLGALIQPAPPYSALLGLARAGLVSRSWADVQAARYPTHALLPEHSRARALDLRPTPDGWIDLQTARDAGATVGMAFTSAERGHRRVSRPGHPDEQTLDELFERIRAYFAAHSSLGRLGGPGPEKGLARLCWILGSFQYAYRNDSIEHPLFRIFRDDVPNVAELHRSADDEAVADPLALTHRLSTSGALSRMRRLAGDPPAGTPLGITHPVIFDHWDDNAFLLSGPDGATLLEVVSLVKADDTHTRGRRRLWKMLAGAWLDTEDTFRIRTLAVYFARHGVLVSWNLTSYAEFLLEGRDPDEARKELVALATHLRDTDRARRTAWREGRET